MRTKRIARNKLALAVSLATAGLSTSVSAQDNEQIKPMSLEEVVVVGRLQSVAASLVDERLELPYSADFLGFEAISRAGDSTIGSALRRVTGLTLIDGKFIYIRGLGERYSSVTVNGAAVPSPDLARSVIPLDLFPSSIVESLKVQKSWGPDLPANFGGGAIDIRTRSVPSGPVASVSIGSGLNTVSDDGLLYPESGASNMPQAIRSALGRYRGDLTTSNIQKTESNESGSSVSTAEAEQIQRNLILALNRNVGIQQSSLDPDRDMKVDLGNAWDVADELMVGGSFSAAYSEQFRNKDQIKRSANNPEDTYSETKRTARDERTTLALLLGVEYAQDNSIQLSSYFISNEYDEARMKTGYSTSNTPDELRPDTSYVTRLEERELTLNQLKGSHRLGEFSPVEFLSPLSLEWFYSDAEAKTDIPNSTAFDGRLDLTSGTPTPSIKGNATSGQFSFLELRDEVESYGGILELPISIGFNELTLSGGWWASSKAREYYGYTVNVGTENTVGTPQTVFSYERIADLDNHFDLDMGSGFGKESYVAAQKVNAIHGGADYRLGESWRFTVGARWEEYQQAVLPIDLLDYSGISLQNTINELSDPNQSYAFQNDDVYGSLGITYLGSSLLNSEEFQIRFGVSETVVRPDIRELADVAYIDPELGVRVFGNPQLSTTNIRNYDLRGEFYYEGGDNFTVSLFYKDLELPIERVEGSASDDDTVLAYVNGESGEVMGVEFEGLYTLPRGFFLSGNVTLSDSEITISNFSEITNKSRRMTGHSEYVVNASLGYDSPDEKHSASLLYNVFGERIFFAGTNGNDDAFEQPFNSLDLVYSYYPTEQISLKFKANNLLDEKREFEQTGFSGKGSTTILEQEVGTSLSASISWKY